MVNYKLCSKFWRKLSQPIIRIKFCLGMEISHLDIAAFYYDSALPSARIFEPEMCSLLFHHSMCFT